MDTGYCVNIDDVVAAHARIKTYIHKTPIIRCHALDEAVGAECYLKCENMQKVGAFKFRGACNAVMSLSDDDARAGVATHSSGNHAQALALAARMRGVPAYIVMPRTAPRVKSDAVAAYGGRITFCEPTLRAREEALARVVAETGARVVHPYNDARVIAGQGTCALELLQEVPDLDAVIAPIGGGGLLSGTAIACRSHARPSGSSASASPGGRVRVIGAEPLAADDACRSKETGVLQPAVDGCASRTVCDGLLTSMGSLTWPIVRDCVDEIATVREDSIVAAMRFVWERAKIVVEPSGCTPLAVLWERKCGLVGKKVGLILSGGNVDLGKLPWQNS
ncbi:serine dehydratase [Pelomyxa schiedti]|nr:serine dehydratase [Pelomyxa schiedti]